MDERLLRRTFEIALSAVEHGNHPFGALLADAEGNVLMEAENTCVGPPRDVTCHAETNLCRLASSLPREAVAKAILYTSTEPCAMCAGAIYWLGVKKVVFSFPESELLQLIGQHPDNPCLHLPTAKVYELGGAKIEVVGPLLEKEGLAVHHKFGWKL